MTWRQLFYWTPLAVAWAVLWRDFAVTLAIVSLAWFALSRYPKLRSWLARHPTHI